MKRSLKIALLVDAVVLVVLIAITVWLNNREVYGLAALTNLGRFVVCYSLSGAALAVLIVLIVVAMLTRK